MASAERARALGAALLSFLLAGAAAGPAPTPPDGAPGAVSPAGPRPAVPEARRERRAPLERPPRPPHGPGPGHGHPPPPPPGGPGLEREKERLREEVEDLRLRVRLQGQAEAERSDPDWWDLPARRRQQRRLRYLGQLRRQLQARQERLAALEGRRPGIRPGEARPEPVEAPADAPGRGEKESPDKDN